MNKIFIFTCVSLMVFSGLAMPVHPNKAEDDDNDNISLKNWQDDTRSLKSYGSDESWGSLVDDISSNDQDSETQEWKGFSAAESGVSAYKPGPLFASDDTGLNLYNAELDRSVKLKYLEDLYKWSRKRNYPGITQYLKYLLTSDLYYSDEHFTRTLVDDISEHIAAGNIDFLDEIDDHLILQKKLNGAAHDKAKVEMAKIILNDLEKF